MPLPALLMLRATIVGDCEAILDIDYTCMKGAGETHPPEPAPSTFTNDFTLLNHGCSRNLRKRVRVLLWDHNNDIHLHLGTIQAVFLSVVYVKDECSHGLVFRKVVDQLDESNYTHPIVCRARSSRHRIKMCRK